jgi:hypothetical protein
MLAQSGSGSGSAPGSGSGSGAGSGVAESLTPEDITFGVICIVTGLVLLFFGYALFKVAVFLAGFYMGYWVCFAIMESINVDYGDQETLIIFISCLVAGLLVGLLLLYLTTVGIFILGALTGFFLACWILSFVDPSAPVQEPLYRWLLIGGMVRGHPRARAPPADTPRLTRTLRGCGVCVFVRACVCVCVLVMGGWSCSQWWWA